MFYNINFDSVLDFFENGENRSIVLLEVSSVQT